MNRTSVVQLLNVLQLRQASETPPSPVVWNDDEIRGLAPLLEFEGAELWFYRRIRQGRVVVPDALIATLRDKANRASVLNMRIDAQTIAVSRLLDNAGIRWSLLKGQARRAAAGRYPMADARHVSDVDLLVEEARADEAWQLLCNNGFRRVIEGPVDWTADHHRPTLIDANNVAVELHTTTSMRVSPTEAWRRATQDADTVEWSGLTTTVPNATERVWQALSGGVSDGHGGFVLKSFLSLAAVLAARPHVDWRVVEHRMQSPETEDNESKNIIGAEQLKRYLAIASWLADTSAPDSMRPKQPVDLATVLLWRSRILASTYGRAVKERLLEECGRVAAGQPITPGVPRSGFLRNVRRRSSSIAARYVYQMWSWRQQSRLRAAT